VNAREPSKYAGQTVKIRPEVREIGGAECRVEDWWTTVYGQSWTVSQSPAAYRYAARTAGDTPLDDDVLYGKIGIFGYLIHVSEIEAERADEAWRECAHGADYSSAADHERNCPYHRGEVDENGLPVDDVPPNAGSAS